MVQAKTRCSKCDSKIRQTSADCNGGLCKRCVNKPKLEKVGERIELGASFLLGGVFSIFAAAIGYGVGSLLGTIGAVVLAVPFALAGFVYGCFCAEINGIIRSLLPLI